MTNHHPIVMADWFSNEFIYIGWGVTALWCTYAAMYDIFFGGDPTNVRTCVEEGLSMW